MKLLLFVYFIVAWSAADAGKMRTYRFGSLTDPLDDKMKDWMRDSPLLIPEPTPQDCRVTADCTCEMNQHTPCKPTINIILLSDCSFCFRDVWTDEITAMKRISKAITKSFSAESNFALMQFGNTGYYPATQPYEFSQPFQLGPIDTAIDGLTFCGGTAYLDQALSRASSYFQSLSPVEAKNPSFLVVLTNGNSVDTVSMKSIQHSVDLLNTSNVTILPVAVDAGGRNDTVFNMLNPKYPNYQFLLSNKASYVTTLIDIMIWYCPCKNAAAAENCICKTEQICEIPSPNVEQYRGPKGPKGVPGMDGIDGPPGPPGPKGLSGQPGNPGTKGEDAPDGFPGPTGPLGQQGSEGDKGSKGPYGENGKPGPPGSKGEEGVVGTKGDKGDKGRKGNIGVEGSKGLKGQPGPQGEPGPSTTGPPGPNGPPGKKGGPGQPGLIGNDGNKGKPGCSGCQGEPGDVGRKGERGPPGVNGKDGSDGPAGPQGPLGRIGRPGAQGPLGNPGVPGPSGVPGNNGRPGSPGSQGVQGLMGLPGPVSNDPGPTGQIGYQGNQGLNGWPGPNGSPGPQGPRGVQGPEGLEGIPGKDRHDQASIEILVWKELRKQYKGCGKPCCTRCDQIEAQVEPNPCNSVAVDLVFFVDGSGSISEFSSIQKWMGNILKTFNGSNEDHLMRVTIVQFSSHVKQELQSYMCNKAATVSGTACQSVAAINIAIKNIKQEKSSTRTWTGVNYLADNFTPFDVNAETIMVTITDGTPTDSDQYNQNALDRVHHMFHKMIAVSVGDDLDTDVLKKLTKHSSIIPVDNLSALDDSIKLLVGELCKEPTTESVDYMPVDDYDDSEEEGV